ncbi:unnamed protein product [Camellia sinensis]
MSKDSLARARNQKCVFSISGFARATRKLRSSAHSSLSGFLPDAVFARASKGGHATSNVTLHFASGALPLDPAVARCPLDPRELTEQLNSRHNQRSGNLESINITNFSARHNSEQIQRKNRRSGIFGGLKLFEVQRHLQLQFLQVRRSKDTNPLALTLGQHIQEGNTIDGIMLKETSTKKSRISNGVSKKEVKTSQTVGVVEEEKNLETRISKGVSSKLIKHEKNKEGRHCRKQTNAMKF